jgi:PAS domain S-box-containing protein
MIPPAELPCNAGAIRWRSNITIDGPTLTDQFGISDFMDAMGDEIVILDRTGVIIATNAAWRQFSCENGGDAVHSFVGSNYLDICRSSEGPSSAEARIIPDGFERTLRTGKQFRCEYPCDSPTVKRWFELTTNRFVRDGETYLIVQHRNITERHVDHVDIEQAFINSNAMVALVATTSDAILSYNLEGKIITWNRAAQKLYGYTEAEALGRSLEMLYPEDWKTPLTYYRDEILAGRLESFEATRVAKDGTKREVWISGAPIRSLDGDVVAISNIHRDVTEIRQAEKARDLIAHEVIHRAKNMLSVVIAIQRQTARNEHTIEGFQRSFEARLMSLAQSTDLLVKSAWTSVDLIDLVNAHLEPFADPNDLRHEFSGPQVNVQPQGVQAIGMAIHELATNSAKYGAFRKTGGRIKIEWSVEQGDDDPTLRFRWYEFGFEINKPSKSNGFGSTVLTALAPAMIGAKTELDIGSRGLEWTISVPAEHFVTRTSEI